MDKALRYCTAAVLVAAFAFGGLEMLNKQDPALPSATSLPDKSLGQQPTTKILADFASSYRTGVSTAACRMDVVGTIRALQFAHLNTYDFIVRPEPSSWVDLQLFLLAAQKAHIQVFVTLMPPSLAVNGGECLAPSPFGYDYVKWAQEIGKLSCKYPNLKALVIDDFWSTQNRSLFTPQYVSRVSSTLHSYNPSIAFLPTLYWQHIGSSPDVVKADDLDFIQTFGSMIDGIVFPYADLTSTDSLPDQLKAIRVWMPAGKELIVNIYATEGPGGPANDVPRTPQYLLKAMTISTTLADGVRLYALPLYKSNALYQAVACREEP